MNRIVIRRVELRRAPGMERPLPRLDDLSPGLNLIYGPNASGKSTLGRAIRRILWPPKSQPDDFEGLSAAIFVEGRDAAVIYETERDRDEDLEGVSGAPADAHRFALADLLRADGESEDEFARELVRTLTGVGRDLGARYAPLGATPLKKEVSQFKKARTTWDAAQRTAQSGDNDDKAREALQRDLDAMPSGDDIRRARDATQAFLDARKAMKIAREALAAAEEGRGFELGDAERLTNLEEALKVAESARDNARAARDAAADRRSVHPRDQVAPAPLSPAETNHRNALIAAWREAVAAHESAQLEVTRAEAERVAFEKRLAGSAVSATQVRDLLALSLDQNFWTDLRGALEAEHAMTARQSEIVPPLEVGPAPERPPEEASLGEAEIPPACPPRVSEDAAWNDLASRPPILIYAGAALALAGAVLALVGMTVLAAVAAFAGALLAAFGAGSGGGPSASRVAGLRERFSAMETKLSEWAEAYADVKANARTLQIRDQTRREVAMAKFEAEERAYREREKLADELKTRNEDRKAQVAAFEARVTDFRRRRSDVLSVVGVTTPLELLGQLAERVKELSDLDRRVEAETAKAHAAERRAENARDAVADAFPDDARIGDGRVGPAELAKELIDAEDWRRTETNLAEAEATLAKLGTDVDAAQRAISDLISARGVGDAPEFRRRAAIAADFLSARRVLDGAEAAFRTAEAALPDASLALAPDLAVQERRDALDRELKTLSSQREDIQRRLGRLNERVSAAEESNDVLLARQRLEAARDDLKVRRDEVAVDAAAATLYHELTEMSRREDQPLALRHANRYIEPVAPGLKIMVSREGGEKLIAEIDDQPRTLGALSDGTRAQVLIASRLGRIAAHEGARRPIFIDEALKTSDPQRGRALMELLLAIAEERQVFVFTNHPDEVLAWREVGGDAVTERLLGVAADAAPQGPPATLDGLSDVSLPDPNSPLSEYRRGLGLDLDPWGWVNVDPSLLPLALLVRDASEERAWLHARLTERRAKVGHLPEDVGDALAATIRERARLFSAFLARWSVGRTRPLRTFEGIDVSDLPGFKAGGQEKFLRKVAECGGDAERAFQSYAARDQGEKWRDELRERLLPHGYVTDDEPTPVANLLATLGDTEPALPDLDLVRQLATTKETSSARAFDLWNPSP